MFSIKFCVLHDQNVLAEKKPGERIKLDFIILCYEGAKKLNNLLVFVHSLVKK